MNNPKLYRCPVTRRQTSMSYLKNKHILFFENYKHLKNRKYLPVIIQDYIINKSYINVATVSIKPSVVGTGCRYNIIHIYRF